jgi:hypothetical protein
MLSDDIKEVQIYRRDGIYITYTRVGADSWREDFYHPERIICPVCGYHYSDMLRACTGRCFDYLDADGKAVGGKFRIRSSLWVKQSIRGCQLLKNRKGQMFFLA